MSRILKSGCKSDPSKIFIAFFLKLLYNKQWKYIQLKLKENELCG